VQSYEPAPLAVPFLKEITVDVAKNSLMKITDICWITPLKNMDICWITHYRPVLAYPQAAAGAYHIWLCHCPFILIASASFLGAYLITKSGKCAYKNNSNRVRSRVRVARNGR
jgi:hypothetical protein